MDMNIMVDMDMGILQSDVNFYNELTLVRGIDYVKGCEGKPSIEEGNLSGTEKDVSNSSVNTTGYIGEKTSLDTGKNDISNLKSDVVVSNGSPIKRVSHDDDLYDILDNPFGTVGDIEKVLHGVVLEDYVTPVKVPKSDEASSEGSVGSVNTENAINSSYHGVILDESSVPSNKEEGIHTNTSNNDVVVNEDNSLVKSTKEVVSDTNVSYITVKEGIILEDYTSKGNSESDTEGTNVTDADVAEVTDADFAEVTDATEGVSNLTSLRGIILEDYIPKVNTVAQPVEGTNNNDVPTDSNNDSDDVECSSNPISDLCKVPEGIILEDYIPKVNTCVQQSEGIDSDEMPDDFFDDDLDDDRSGGEDDGESDDGWYDGSNEGDEPKGVWDDVSNEDDDEPEDTWYDGSNEDDDEPEDTCDDGTDAMQGNAPKGINDIPEDFYEEDGSDVDVEGEADVGSNKGTSDTKVIDFTSRTGISNPTSDKLVKVVNSEGRSELKKIPHDIREFLKLYPNSEISEVSKYYPKKEIIKQLKLGRIIKYKNKLSI